MDQKLCDPGKPCLQSPWSPQSLVPCNLNGKKKPDLQHKCELVDVAIQYDDLEEPAYLKDFDDGLCSNIDPAEWRGFWYDNMDEPW